MHVIFLASLDSVGLFGLLLCCWCDSLYYWSWFRIWTVSVVFAGWLPGFDHDLVTASLCVAWHLPVELSLGISLFGSFSIGTGNEADTTCGLTQIAPLYGLFVHFGWLACVLLLAGSCDPCLVTGLYQYWLVAVLMCEILTCWIMLCLAPPPCLVSDLYQYWPADFVWLCLSRLLCRIIFLTVLS
jgi:hypothetical protein